MKKTKTMKKSIRLVSATLATGGLLTVGIAANANVSQNPFDAERLSSGYMVADSHGADKDKPCKRDGKKMGEGKCGEGKCGEGKRGEGKCGEGKCGEGKCGEGKRGEGKCGEGKCGEGKRGEGKCGEGKCG